MRLHRRPLQRAFLTSPQAVRDSDHHKQRRAPRPWDRELWRTGRWAVMVQYRLSRPLLYLLVLSTQSVCRCPQHLRLLPVHHRNDSQ